jgi:serine/threonine protein kinase
MALSTGTRLGPYEILSIIGARRHGDVYRGRDTRLDRTVAIKVLLPPHVALARESSGTQPGRLDWLDALSERRDHNRIAERPTIDVERLLPNSPTF